MASLLSSATSSQGLKKSLRDSNYQIRRKSHRQRLERLGVTSESRAEIVERVKARLGSDVDASDFLLSLFLSALFSYRRAEICEPFPDDFFHEDDEKNFETVELYAKALPDVKHFAENPVLLSNLPQPALKLLSWAIDPQLYEGLQVNRIPLQQYREETSRFSLRRGPISDPQLVFKVNYTDDHHSYERFADLVTQHGSILGFHGSPLENMHSIIRNGLDATFGKEGSLFGEGIYLSEDQDVAFTFLKPGLNKAPNSLLGPQVGCLICGESSSGSRIGLTVDEKLPKGYILVSDNTCVIVRYVLVYTDFASPAPRKVNVCWILAFFYVTVLALLYFARSPTMRSYYGRYMTEF